MWKIGLTLCLLLHISASPCASLTKEQHEAFMKAEIYKAAFSKYVETQQELKETFGKIAAEKIDAAESIYLNKGIEQDVAYFNKTQPFYNEMRMYANALFSRAYAMWNFVDDFSEKKEVTWKVEKLMETGDIKQADQSLYVSMLDSSPVFVNDLAENEEKILGIINPNHIYCTYDNYDTLATILNVTADALINSGSAKGATAGGALGIFSSVDRQEFSCRYWGKLKQYVIGYFYHGLTERFFTQETTQASAATRFNGIAFSTTTIKSTLEYVSVRLDIEGKNGVEKFFYAFGIDRANKQLVPIDPNTFLNEIASRYKPS